MIQELLNVSFEKGGVYLEAGYGILSFGYKASRTRCFCLPIATPSCLPITIPSYPPIATTPVVLIQDFITNNAGAWLSTATLSFVRWLVSQLVTNFFLFFIPYPNSNSRTFQNLPEHQRLRVFVHFQLSTAWLNSKVKGSAPRLQTRQFWHERQHCSSGNDVFKHNETSTVG